MTQYGIVQQVCGWTKAFLYKRTQKVNVNGEESDWMDIISGVPQGSVLGPVLFVVYINDLPEEVLSELLLYADDAKIFREITERLT